MLLCPFLLTRELKVYFWSEKPRYWLMPFSAQTDQNTRRSSYPKSTVSSPFLPTGWMWVKSSNLKIYSFFYSYGNCYNQWFLGLGWKKPMMVVMTGTWRSLGGPQSRAGDSSPRRWEEVDWQAFEHPSQLCHFTHGSGIYPLSIHSASLHLLTIYWVQHCPKDTR